MSRRAKNQQAQHEREGREPAVVYVARASSSTEFDKDSIAIHTGLYQLDEASGRKLALFICSEAQRDDPHRPFFVESGILEGESPLIFCPRCGKTHDTMSLMAAFTDGWLDIQAMGDWEDTVPQFGFTVDPRTLVLNEIRWLGERAVARSAGKIRRAS